MATEVHSFSSKKDYRNGDGWWTGLVPYILGASSSLFDKLFLVSALRVLDFGYFDLLDIILPI